MTEKRLQDVFFFSHIAVMLAYTALIVWLISETYMRIQDIRQSSNYNVSRSVVAAWKQNFIQDIQATSQIQCPPGYADAYNYTWPGTRDLCACASTQGFITSYIIYTQNCTQDQRNQRCIYSEKINPTQMAFWRTSKKFCVKKSSVSFFSSPTSCDGTSFQACGSGNARVCVPNGEACPVTNIILSKSNVQLGYNKVYLDDTYSLFYQNKKDTYPVSHLRVGEDSFCLDMNENNISPNNFDYKYLNRRRSPCRRSDNQYTVLDTLGEDEMYAYNKLTPLVANLPAYPRLSKETKWNLGYRTNVGWSLSCRQSEGTELQEVEKRVFLDMERNVQIGLMVVVLVSVLIGGIILPIIDISKRFGSNTDRASSKAIKNILLCLHLFFTLVTLALILVCLVRARDDRNWFGDTEVCADDYFITNISRYYREKLGDLYNWYVAMLILWCIMFVIELIYIIIRCQKDTQHMEEAKRGQRVSEPNDVENRQPASKEEKQALEAAKKKEAEEKKLKEQDEKRRKSEFQKEEKKRKEAEEKAKKEEEKKRKSELKIADSKKKSVVNIKNEEQEDEQRKSLIMEDLDKDVSKETEFYRNVVLSNKEMPSYAEECKEVEFQDNKAFYFEGNQKVFLEENLYYDVVQDNVRTKALLDRSPPSYLYRGENVEFQADRKYYFLWKKPVYVEGKQVYFQEGEKKVYLDTNRGLYFGKFSNANVEKNKPFHMEEDRVELLPVNFEKARPFYAADGADNYLEEKVPYYLEWKRPVYAEGEKLVYYEGTKRLYYSGSKLYYYNGNSRSELSSSGKHYLVGRLPIKFDKKPTYQEKGKQVPFESNRFYLLEGSVKKNVDMNREHRLEGNRLVQSEKGKLIYKENGKDVKLEEGVAYYLDRNLDSADYRLDSASRADFKDDEMSEKKKAIDKVEGEYDKNKIEEKDLDKALDDLLGQGGMVENLDNK